MPEDKNIGGTVDYWPSPQEKEGLAAGAGRQAVRTAVNVGERLLGAPANLAEGALNLVNAGIELLPGVQQSPLPRHLPLPTSEAIHEYITEPIAQKVLPPGYLEPQNQAEEMADTVIKDFADILLPGKAISRGAKALKGLKGATSLAKGASGIASALPFAKSFSKLASFLNPGNVTVGKAALVSGLGNLAGYGSKYLGAEPGTQAGLKVGTMLAASLGGPNTLANHIKDLYGKAEELLPKAGSSIPAKGLLSTLENLNIEEVNKGFSKDVVPAKGFLEKSIENVKEKTSAKTPNIEVDKARQNLETIIGSDKVKNFPEFTRTKIHFREPTIPVDEAWKLKKELNKVIFESNSKTDSTKIFYAEQVRDALNASLKGPEALKKFPEFTQALTEADKMMSGFKNVSEVSKFLVGHSIMKDLQNPITKAVFYHNLSGGVLNAAKALATASTFKNTIVPIEMFMKSPEIRNYYYKAMKAAYAKNAAVANKYIKKFDHEANKINPGYAEGPGTVE